MKKQLAVLLAVMGISVAGAASAAEVYTSTGAKFSTGENTANSYKVALEVYNNTAGATTIAGDTLSYGQINIKLSQPLYGGQNVNIRISSGNADFNSAGPGFNRYGLCDLGTTLDNTTSTIEPCPVDGIIAALPPSGVTTPNLGFQVTGDIGFLTVDRFHYIRLVQWNDANNNAQYDAGEVLTEGASIYLHPGLDPQCPPAAPPIVKMTFSSAGGEATPEPFNFAYITPQFTFSSPSTGALNAELNTDLDFKQFVAGSGESGTTVDPTSLYAGTFFNVTDLAENRVPNSMWIDFAYLPVVADLTYKLATAVAQPGITDVLADGTSCTADSTGLIYTCTANDTTLTGAHTLQIDLNGTGENNPTNWTVSDFGVSVATTEVSKLCTSAFGPAVGSWYGGIEAIVPFVKQNAAGYKTTIKLFNRYGKPAKVYVADMNANSNSIVTSINLLGTIATGDFLVVTGDTLKAAGILDDTKLDNGAPIKFLIRVPAQMNSLPFTTLSDTAVSGSIVDVAAGAITSVMNGGTAAGVARASVVDPYINGIVVQETPSGAQRTVPLQFKSFKQGQYN